MTREEADRRGLGAIRGMVIAWLASVAVLVVIYAIGRLCAGHPVAFITGAAVVLGAYLWLFRDRNDTTTTDDEDGAL